MESSLWVPTRPWNMPFLASVEQVSPLRRALRNHLEYWGLHELTDAAELCVSELVANVIKHVGAGTPSTLIASLNGPQLRVEVHDPDPRALPTLVCTGLDAEEGRGMVLVDAMSDRWGVELTGDRKVTWCEFQMNVAGADRDVPRPRLARAADVLSLYNGSDSTPYPVGRGRLDTAVAEEAAIDVITDLLYWFRVHGRDVDDVLDRAQAHFEAESAARPL
ncbi:ATP-binding protein [Streptomyces sp. AC627_RSS907]|uniref:ATP-binding protein n=1 Tax=Streptomyces sp. AC627_RSS907 TaxID=2823684 RepID=UPI0020B85DDF|nr:ATP-binding protein [Streptomyces sp. AC627_RSS907]